MAAVRLGIAAAKNKSGAARAHGGSVGCCRMLTFDWQGNLCQTNAPELSVTVTEFSFPSSPAFNHVARQKGRSGCVSHETYIRHADQGYVVVVARPPRRPSPAPGGLSRRKSVDSCLMQHVLVNLMWTFAQASETRSGETCS